MKLFTCGQTESTPCLIISTLCSKFLHILYTYTIYRWQRVKTSHNDFEDNEIFTEI